jgi:16S rRNA (guanine(1405)-N(7))-methyltransferase
MNDPTPIDSGIIQQLANTLRASRKYRSLELPDAMLYDLITQEMVRYGSQKKVLDAVREKLHNIVAPYLGDPDYARAARQLTTAQAAGPEALRTACLGILTSHASTRERIHLLDEFYPRLWQVTGKPESILDLACGLHPFGLPWMDLEPVVKYYAYDIHKPRVELLNHFFNLTGREPLAVQEDVLVNPPEVTADVALFFKEAHRFEQRRRGCNLPFWQALNVRWLLVSLPSSSLSGKRNLVERQRKLMDSILAGQSWTVKEIIFENEMVFCIQTL